MNTKQLLQHCNAAVRIGQNKLASFRADFPPITCEAFVLTSSMTMELMNECLKFERRDNVYVGIQIRLAPARRGLGDKLSPAPQVLV